MVDLHAGAPSRAARSRTSVPAPLRESAMKLLRPTTPAMLRRLAISALALGAWAPSAAGDFTHYSTVLTESGGLVKY